jgi:predicted MFS family arabinose efflux permease
MAQSTTAISISRTFASLRHPNYRLWFIGQLLSLVGTWMQNTAQGYLIYELTGSALYLGLVSFAAGVPTWLFTLFGGVIADRIPRRNLLLVTQTSAMLLAFILAVLVLTGTVRPWMILILAFLLGTVNAFEAPVRISFVRELVSDREDMPNAIALNATLFNAAATVGPAVGGLVYAAVGPGLCFTINGISFIAVLIALGLMRIAAMPAPLRRLSAVSQLKEGFTYVMSEPAILYLMVGSAILSICGFGLFALMPAWAKGVLGGDATTNGLLNSARGLGSMIGALLIATLSHLKRRGKMWSIGSYALPLFTLLFAIMRLLPLSLLMLLGFGLNLMMIANINNALIQMEVPDELRGRVMSIYTLVFQGGFPIGSLLAGAAAAQIGEPATVGISATLLFVFAIFTTFRRPEIRRME